MFNLIDTNEGLKADLVPLRREPEYRLAFERRIRRDFVDLVGNTFTAWVAQPTDIIIGKLRAWDEGRSNKHLGDIHSILFFCLQGYSDHPVNIDEVTVEAAKIGSESLDMWNKILARVQQEIKNGNSPRKW